MNSAEKLSLSHFGYVSGLSVFILGILYAIITTLGFLSLESPKQQIPDPYFSMMEVLSILISLGMAFCFTALFFIENLKPRKLAAFLALLMMYLATAITSCVHFVVLSLRSSDHFNIGDYDYLFSFTWPSVVYALDILAWDWFYALSVLFAAFLFGTYNNTLWIRRILLISGLLSLAGLMGVYFENMAIRNVGILGYAVVGPIAFLLVGRSFIGFFSKL